MKKVIVIGNGGAGTSFLMPEHLDNVKERLMTLLKEHEPEILIINGVGNSEFTEIKKPLLFEIKALPKLTEIWIDPKEPIVNYKKHYQTCLKNRKKRKKKKRR